MPTCAWVSPEIDWLSPYSSEDEWLGEGIADIAEIGKQIPHDGHEALADISTVC